MIHIPLDVDVVCTDGVVGKSSSIIVNRETLHPTHFVVKEKKKPHQERLVSINNVEKTEMDEIHLNCKIEHVLKMEEFLVTTFTQVENMSYHPVGYGTSMPFMYATQSVEHYEVKEMNIPEGGVAISSGMTVLASDGPVGRVADLLKDPKNNQITHFMMHETHLWGGKNIFVPLTLVRFVDNKGVNLKVDKEAISAMLAVPSRRLGDLTFASLGIVTFPDTTKARAFRENIQKNHAINFSNAAVLVKESDGKTSIQESHDLDKKQGAIFGAITGGLLGLLGGPVGMAVGAATGAVTGSAAARRIDMGFPDEYLNKLQEGLKSGSSALVILLDDDQLPSLAEAAAVSGGQFIHQKLTHDIFEHISLEEE